MNSLFLKNTINDLKQHMHKDKFALLSSLIDERLDKALVEYYKNLDKSFNKLLVYSDEHNLSLIRKINRS